MTESSSLYALTERNASTLLLYATPSSLGSEGGVCLRILLYCEPEGDSSTRKKRFDRFIMRPNWCSRSASTVNTDRALGTRIKVSTYIDYCCQGFFRSDWVVMALLFFSFEGVSLSLRYSVFTL